MFTNSGKKKLNKGYKIVTFLLVALIGIETFSLCYHPLKVTNLLLFEDDQVLALNKPSGCASIESLLPPILETDLSQTILFLKNLPIFRFQDD